MSYDSDGPLVETDENRPVVQHALGQAPRDPALAAISFDSTETIASPLLRVAEAVAKADLSNAAAVFEREWQQVLAHRHGERQYARRHRLGTGAEAPEITALREAAGAHIDRARSVAASAYDAKRSSLTSGEQHRVATELASAVELLQDADRSAPPALVSRALTPERSTTMTTTTHADQPGVVSAETLRRGGQQSFHTAPRGADLLAPIFRSGDLDRLHTNVEASQPSLMRALTSTAVASFVDNTGSDAGHFVSFRREGTFVQDILPAFPITAPSVFYSKFTGAASAAAAVAEGGQKPLSSPALTRVQVDVKKVATVVEITSESVADDPQFELAVVQELTSGLAEAVELQIISGSGTGANVQGLLGASGVLVYAPGTAEPRSVSIRKAWSAVRNGPARADSSTVVLHPSDYELLHLERASTGEYVNNSPMSDAQMMIWNMTPIVTTRIAPGTALVGNFPLAASLYVRQGISVNSDPFSKLSSNLIQLVAEARFALAIQNGSALVKVTFNGPV